MSADWATGAARRVLAAGSTSGVSASTVDREAVVGPATSAADPAAPPDVVVVGLMPRSLDDLAGLDLMLGFPEEVASEAGPDLGCELPVGVSDVALPETPVFVRALTVPVVTGLGVRSVRAAPAVDVCGEVDFGPAGLGAPWVAPGAPVAEAPGALTDASDPLPSSARATPCPVTSAVPTPSAIASPPTRPTCVAAPIPLPRS
ncbi:hypothetical protein [Mycolicibacterium sediminis]|uniref:hypothetical protein n=1 Tax=Mycolicibacterium sediminis TaxID=1286180 RepID=UPI0027E34578|nr:hypothetical protein [Mycolicibacterium sediminis]